MSRAEILGQTFVGRAEILGRDEILGWADDGTVQHEILGRDEILGDERFVGYLDRPEIVGALPRMIQRAIEQARAKALAQQQARAKALAQHKAKKQSRKKTRPEIRGDDVLGFVDDSTVQHEILGRTEIMGLDEILGAERFVGDDEVALAKEGTAEREALARRTGVGYNSAWANIRGDVGKDPSTVRERLEYLRPRLEKLRVEQWKQPYPIVFDKKFLTETLNNQYSNPEQRASWKILIDEKIVALASSGRRFGKDPTGKKEFILSGSSAGEQEDRQRACEILSRAAGAKTISRADLKRAIWLHAGTASTERERLEAGRHMLEFLNKRAVRLT